MKCTDQKAVQLCDTFYIHEVMNSTSGQHEDMKQPEKL